MNISTNKNSLDEINEVTWEIKFGRNERVKRPNQLNKKFTYSSLFPATSDIEL